jgi:serine/threonine-protein phosphatase 2B regulatory subunit
MSKRNNGTGSITRDQFGQILQKHIKLWNGGSLFMERLFDAFDADGSKSIEVDEFIRGLSVFSKGTPEEKLECNLLYEVVKKDLIISKYHSKSTM